MEYKHFLKVISCRTIFNIVETPEGFVIAWCTCAPGCTAVSFGAPNFFEGDNPIWLSNSFKLSNFALNPKNVGAPGAQMLVH